jgi:hypothetical protein
MGRLAPSSNFSRLAFPVSPYNMYKVSPTRISRLQTKATTSASWERRTSTASGFISKSSMRINASSVPLTTNRNSASHHFPHCSTTIPLSKYISVAIKTSASSSCMRICLGWLSELSSATPKTISEPLVQQVFLVMGEEQQTQKSSLYRTTS